MSRYFAATIYLARSPLLTNSYALFINCWHAKCPQYPIDKRELSHHPESLSANTKNAARETYAKTRLIQ